MPPPLWPHARSRVHHEGRLLLQRHAGVPAGDLRRYEAGLCEICERCGLKALPVVADSGQIGGDTSVEFMALADAGEAGARVLRRLRLRCGRRGRFHPGRSYRGSRPTASCRRFTPPDSRPLRRSRSSSSSPRTARARRSPSSTSRAIRLSPSSPAIMSSTIARPNISLARASTS